MIWLLLVTVLLLLLVLSIKKQLYWKENNVKQGPPIPIFGDLIYTSLRLRTFISELQRFYDRFPNDRFSGIYFMTKPTLLLRDPELIKQITIKDFHHFSDHRRFLPNECDPLWSSNLFFLEGEKWHEMRSTLSPAFTGSKMKMLFALINECAELHVDYYQNKPGSVESVDLKDSFTRFTNDVIASCAFGLKCDSLRDRENEFYLKGVEASDFFTFKKVFCILMNLFSPALCKFLGLRLISVEVTEFFNKIITDTIKMREANNIHRPDMLNLLMDTRHNRLTHDDDDHDTESKKSTEEIKPKKIEWTDMDVTAQAFIFFLAGFETVATTLAFCAYELAVNPDVQEKLFSEIDEVRSECEKGLNYDALMKMKYLDNVITETLRKWPSPIATDRVCVKDYTIQPQTPTEKPVQIKKGDIMWIPTMALQRDPDHFPEPEKFRPERFNEENKDNIHPYTYLPFGSGPRNCIGSRFALMEIKTLLFHLVGKFELTVVDKTDIPLRMKKGSFLVVTENGIWVGFKKRN